ncbi:MAG: methionine sulfoxide reductase heme-binding subunit [Thermoleophilaceae bacterium]|jgi:predicted ferric reductase|nr:methionine sulfoxide reductase heme-binding subunit [Thermoleophilaceae bacterium]
MALWYFTRASGAASLVLLTATLVLGVVDVGRWTSPRFPRFVTDALHRTVSLLVVVFVALHVLTAVLDTFAPVRLPDAVVPFGSAYRPLWLGLGAMAFDLLLALVVTSLLRARLGMRTWRVVHWTAYACWPLALVHGLGSGSDVRSGWMLWLSIGCAGVVALAVLVRAGAAASEGLALAWSVGALAVAGLALAVWLPSGPLARGWASKSGTPPALVKPAARNGASP